MAESNPSIFNKKATEKLRSPDDLDKYVRVTNPSVWVVLAACIALLGGLLAWGVFGAVTTSVTATGAVIDVSNMVDKQDIEAAGFKDARVAMCFLSAEDVAKVETGDSADVGGVQMNVKYISRIPNAPDEWDESFGSEYLVKALFTGDWAYPVVFEGDTSDLEENLPVTVTITTDRIAPISLLFKNQGQVDG